MVRWRDGQIDASLERFRPIIERHSAANGLPASLVSAVVRAESGGDPRAVSRANCRGLMQINDITEREVLARTGMARGDLFDPDYNIAVGCAYLRQLLDRFDDRRLAVAAYNMGPTRLDALRRSHPQLAADELIQQHAPAETKAYVEKVLGS